MKRTISELSVFFPAYNEEENIEETVRSAKKILNDVAQEWEILIINDGSTDKTGKIAQSLAREDKRIRVITHSPNRGYGGALKSGFSNSRFPWVCFTDSDGQFHFSEIKRFLPHTKEADLILGFRLKRADPFIRRAYTAVWALIPRLVWGLKVKDYSCGFKLIKKQVFDEVQPLVGEEKVTQIELLIKAKKEGFRFAEVGVQHFPRKYGKQSGANLKVVLKSISDLYKLWQKLR